MDSVIHPLKRLGPGSKFTITSLSLRIGLQLFLSEEMCTRQSRKVIWVPNMGYDQYTVPDTVAVESTFVAFP